MIKRLFGDCPNLHRAGHVSGRNTFAVGRDRDGADPVLELAASPLTEVADKLPVCQIPDFHESIPAAGEDVLAVGMEGKIGGAVEMAGRGFTDLFAGGRIEECDLTAEAIGLAATADRQPFAVGRVCRRRSCVP